MSAPNPGRQSPDPDTQRGGQATEAPGDGGVGAAPSEDHAKNVSEDALNSLESNPEGPLEGAAHEKVSKDGRGNNV